MSCLEASGAVQFTKIDVTAAGDNVLVAGVPGRRIRVLSLALIANAELTIRFKSDLTALSGPVRLVENLALQAETPWGCFETQLGKPLVLELSGALQASGWLAYQETR